MKRKRVKIVAKRKDELLVEFASDDEERQAEWLEENDLNFKN